MMSKELANKLADYAGIDLVPDPVGERYAQAYTNPAAMDPRHGVLHESRRVGNLTYADVEYRGKRLWRVRGQLADGTWIKSFEMPWHYCQNMDDFIGKAILVSDE
jgi:hypothetical protein